MFDAARSADAQSGALYDEAMTSVASPPLHQILVLTAGAPLRRRAEQCVERAYREAFASSIPSHHPNLMCVLDQAGAVRAAVGYRLAGEEPLFLENYLSAPIEAVFSRACGTSIAREKIAEIGNLACLDKASSALLFAALARRLTTLGCTHAAATATRPLRRIFRRVGFQTIEFARAEAARAPDGGAAWGRYYDFDPVVVGGAIRACCAPLHQRRATVAVANV
jgi:hypothetical protein